MRTRHDSHNDNDTHTGATTATANMAIPTPQRQDNRHKILHQMNISVVATEAEAYDQTACHHCVPDTHSFPSASRLDSTRFTSFRVVHCLPCTCIRTMCGATGRSIHILISSRLTKCRSAGALHTYRIRMPFMPMYMYVRSAVMLQPGCPIQILSCGRMHVLLMLMISANPSTATHIQCTFRANY